MMPSILWRLRRALPSDSAVAQRPAKELWKIAATCCGWPCGAHEAALALIVALFGLRDRSAAQSPHRLSGSFRLVFLCGVMCPRGKRVEGRGRSIYADLGRGVCAASLFSPEACFLLCNADPSVQIKVVQERPQLVASGSTGQDARPHN